MWGRSAGGLGTRCELITLEREREHMEVYTSPVAEVNVVWLTRPT